MVYNTPVSETGTQRQVQELISQFVSVVRSSRLYREDHVAVDKMIDRFHGMVSEFVSGRGPLEIEIDRDGLRWEGHMLVKALSQQGDIAFRLYQDGIRLITFLPGVTMEEIRTLTGTFLVDTHTIEYQDHDLATVLWQESMPSIRMAVVEPFLQFVHGLVDGGEDTLMDDVDHISTRLHSHMPPGSPGVARSADSFDVDLSLVEPPDPDAMRLNEEEIRGGALSRLMNILFENLESDNPSLVNKASENFGIIMHLILDTANLAAINRLLNTMIQRQQDSLKPFHLKIQSADTLEKLSSSLEDKADWSGADLAMLLNKLDPEPSRMMIQHLLKWEEEHSLENLKEALTSFFKFHEDILLAVIPYLPHDRFDRLLDLLEGQSCMEKVIEEALHNPVPEVRYSAFRKIETPSSNRLSSMLWDDSVKIRLAVLNKIAQLGRDDLVEDLKVAISQDAFLGRSIQEQEKWFVVSAMVGRESLITFFMDFFQRRSTLVDFAKGDERPRLAAKALGIIGSGDTISLLEHEAKKLTNPPALRKACQDALVQVRRKLGKTDGDERA